MCVCVVLRNFTTHTDLCNHHNTVYACTFNYGVLESSQILKTRDLGRISKDRAQRERRELGVEHRRRRRALLWATEEKVLGEEEMPKLPSKDTAMPAARTPPPQLLD